MKKVITILSLVLMSSTVFALSNSEIETCFKSLPAQTQEQLRTRDLEAKKLAQSLVINPNFGSSTKGALRVRQEASQASTCEETIQILNSHVEKMMNALKTVEEYLR